MTNALTESEEHFDKIIGEFTAGPGTVKSDLYTHYPGDVVVRAVGAKRYSVGAVKLHARITTGRWQSAKFLRHEYKGMVK